MSGSCIHTRPPGRSRPVASRSAATGSLEVHEHAASEDSVEAVADVVQCAHVGNAELHVVPVQAKETSPFHRGRVAVDPGHTSLRPDYLGRERRDVSGAAAEIENLRARCKAGAREQPCGLRQQWNRCRLATSGGHGGGHGTRFQR